MAQHCQDQAIFELDAGSDLFAKSRQIGRQSRLDHGCIECFVLVREFHRHIGRLRNPRIYFARGFEHALPPFCTLRDSLVETKMSSGDVIDENLLKLFKRLANVLVDLCEIKL